MKALELFLFLSRFFARTETPDCGRRRRAPIRRSRSGWCARFTTSSSNLDRRITIEDLSRQYLMNPTTLKAMFKSVYGTYLAAHVKEHRMSGPPTLWRPATAWPRLPEPWATRVRANSPRHSRNFTRRSPRNTAGSTNGTRRAHGREGTAMAGDKMKRILIVEDELDIEELLAAYLRDAGYEVALAGDGVEAIRLSQSETFDLVLLDLMLPRMDGFGVCELIPAALPGSHPDADGAGRGGNAAQGL